MVIELKAATAAAALTTYLMFALLCMYVSSMYPSIHPSPRIMPLIREKKVFILSCQLLLKLSKANLLTAHKLKAAQALALLTETEDFSTHTAQYYSADDCSAVLVELREGLLSELMKDFSNR